MKTFEKTYGNLVVDFNNENEYIEMGSLYKKPDFAGILIREKFSEKWVEFFPDQIKFFLKELKQITKPGREENPLVKLIHKYGWSNYHSDLAIVISDYNGINVKFFMEVSHQFNSAFDSIKTKSPEFKLETIIQILEDAVSLIGEIK